MARNEKLRVDIEANDQASGKIDRVADKAEALDKKSPNVKVDANTDSAKAKLEELFDILDDSDLPIDGLGSKLKQLASPGGAVAALGAGLLLAGKHAADIAFEAENLATLTGDSVEEASRLNAVWKQSGADSKDLQDVLLQMNGVLATNADLAGQLGINLADGATIGQRFEQVAAALDKIPDAAQRSQLASQLFGEEGVRQYNNMRNAVGDLSDAMANVPAGSVIDEDDVEQAREMQEQMREVTAEFQAFATKLGTVVLPALSALFEGFNDLFTGSENVGRSIRSWFDGGAAQRNREFADATDRSVDAVERFDSSLLDGVKTTEEAKRIIDEYAASIDDAGSNLNVGAVLLAQWTGAQRDAETAALLHTESMRDQARAADHTAGVLGETERIAREKADADEEAAQAAEEHARKVDELYSAGQRLVGGDIAVRDAQREAAEAMAALSENATAQSAEVDKATQAQLNAASAAAEHRIKQAEASGEILTARDRSAIHRDELQKLADKLDGPVRDAILGYISELDAIPRSVDTWVNTNYRDIYHSEMRRDEANPRGPTRHSGGRTDVGTEYHVLPGEVFVPDVPGRVMSRPDSARMAQQTAAQPAGRYVLVSFDGAVFHGVPDERWVAQIGDMLERRLRGLR